MSEFTEANVEESGMNYYSLLLESGESGQAIVPSESADGTSQFEARA
jgi:hypothetical protein